MVRGHVKWFDNRKGFGFVRTDGLDEDIFCHYSNIAQDGFKCLQDGEAVEFDLEAGEKGHHALNVRRVSEPAPTDPSDSDGVSQAG